MNANANLDYYTHGSMFSWDNAKSVKSQKYGVLNGVLYMAPHKLAGLGNACPHATQECIAACLNTSGHGAFSNVQLARINRSRFYHGNRELFLARAEKDIRAAVRRAARTEGLHTVAVRINGTTDWPLELARFFGLERMRALQQWAMEEYGIVLRFYDYTKYPMAARRWEPGLYDLTYSFTGTEKSARWARDWLRAGVPVAVVFRDRALVERLMVDGWAFPHGSASELYPVVDGDAHDIRWGEGASIVALYAKGKARSQQSIFIQEK